MLMSVQGIGAKASMAILGTLAPMVCRRAIALGDWNAVKAAPGVGPKIAQRVVNELKDKAPGVMAMGGGVKAAMGELGAETTEVIEPRPRQHQPPQTRRAQSEALSALQKSRLWPRLTPPVPSPRRPVLRRTQTRRR